MAKAMSKLYTKNISRFGFLVAIVGLSVVGFAVHHFLILVWPSLGASDVDFVITKSVLAFVYMTVLTPFVLRRLNDIGTSSWWVIVFWMEAVFSLRNIVLVDVLWDIQVNPFSWPLVILNVSSLILFIVLLFSPSCHESV